MGLCYRLRRKLCQRRRNSKRAHHQEHDVLHVHVQSEYLYVQHYRVIIISYNILNRVFFNEI